MKNTLYRQSPVVFSATPKQTTVRDNWTVVLTYENEGDGPVLVDLSHLPKWDLQSDALDAMAPLGCTVPQQPGKSRLDGPLLISRLNATRAVLWGMGSYHSAMPAGDAYTDITDAKLLLALLGPDVFAITEKLTAMDFQTPEGKVPFVLQGPICHQPGQAVVLERNGSYGCVLISCSRGYARDLVDAILGAGEAFGLRVSGENRFAQWLAQSQVSTPS